MFNSHAFKFLMLKLYLIFHIKPCLILVCFNYVGIYGRNNLGVEFVFQQLYFPFNGISSNKTQSQSAGTPSTLAYFPNGAKLEPITPAPAPSILALVLDNAVSDSHETDIINQYGVINNTYPWVFDLNKSPTGVTFLFRFKLRSVPTISYSPKFILSAGPKFTDRRNAGFDIQVNAGVVEIRFGYQAFNWKCKCDPTSGAVSVWHSVHAASRNYFGLLQYTMAVDDQPCGPCEADKQQKYDATIEVNNVFIGTQDPECVAPCFTDLALDELRIYNMWTSIADPRLTDVGCCSAEATSCSCADPASTLSLLQVGTALAIRSECADRDQCTSHPCSDICVNDPHNYHCGCPVGYFLGSDQTKCISQCTGVVCHNNTDCFPVSHGFDCNCNLDFAGALCEDHVDHCVHRPCVHGTCTNVRGGWRCACEVDYVGEVCDELVIDCARQPCRHGGTCELLDSDVGFKCTCTADYKGAVCETHVDLCLGHICEHGGTCEVENGEAKCKCVSYVHLGATWRYFGEFCERSKHPCRINPCLHQGTCQEVDDRAKCICTTGHTGEKDCSGDVDECAATIPPCTAPATCINTIGSFVCSCPKGKELPDCTANTKMCGLGSDPMYPCQHGSTCTDFNNGLPSGTYKCSCVPPYVGINCEILGVNRMTVTPTQMHVVAGTTVTFILQCAQLGNDPARFLFNMGDRLYFNYTVPLSSTVPDQRYKPDATAFILRETGKEITLADPAQRFVYLYDHWFNEPGEYSLAVEGYNQDYPSAKYLTIVHVAENPDICFPTVHILNGGLDYDHGPKFQKKMDFVIESVVTFPTDPYQSEKNPCNDNATLRKYSYEWNLFKWSQDDPIPNARDPHTSYTSTYVSACRAKYPQTVDQPDYCLLNGKFMRVKSGILPYGHYMDHLKVIVTVTTAAGVTKEVQNLDRGWFSIVPSPIKVVLIGGHKRTVGVEDLIRLTASASYESETDPNPVYPSSLKRGKIPWDDPLWFDKDLDAREPAGIVTFYWFKKLHGEAQIEVPRIRDALIDKPAVNPAKCAAANCGFIPVVSSEDRILAVTPSMSLEVGKVYNFTVIAQVTRKNLDNRNGLGTEVVYQGSASQLLNVTAGKRKELIIECIRTNCANRIDQGERFVLQAKCPLCTRSEKNTRRWEASASNNASFKALVWLGDMEFPQKSKYLAVIPNRLRFSVNESTEEFLYNGIYTFNAYVDVAGDTLEAEYTTWVNDPPHMGACKIFPTEGIELETFFEIECWDFYDDDQPMTYRFHFYTGEEHVAKHKNVVSQDNEGSLLFYNFEPYMPPTLLMKGSAATNYTGTIYVTVYDGLNSISLYDMNVTVRPRPHSGNDAIHYAKEKQANIEKLTESILSGNSPETAELITAMSKELNDNAWSEKERTVMRTDLIHNIKDVDVYSLSAVQQIAASTAELLARPGEITSDRVDNFSPQETASSIMERLGEGVRDQLLYGIGPYEMEEAAGFIVKSLTNLIQSISNEKSTNEQPDYKTSNMLQATMDMLTEGFGYTKVPGEDATEFHTEELRLIVQQELPCTISATLNKGTMKRYLELPETLTCWATDENKDDPDRQAYQIQAMYSEKSIYWTKHVNTPNVELTFIDPTTNDLLHPAVTDPVHVVLPLHDERTSSETDAEETECSAVAMDAKFYSSMNMTVKKVEVPKGKSLVVVIRLQSSPIPINVMIAETEKPSLETGDKVPKTWTIAPFVSDDLLEFDYLFPAKDRSGTTEIYYVAIAAGDLEAYRDPENKVKSVDNPPKVETVTFLLTTMSVACLYWDNANKLWQEDGCEVSPRTTLKVLHCDCLHLSTFAGGLFKVPNALTPIADVDLASVFFSNPVTVATMAVVWILYFAFLMLTRRLDKVEEAKRGVHILNDNDPSDQYYYVMTIFTGMRPWAGTTAKVGIILKGTNDQTDPHVLNDTPNMTFFETGGEDSFLIAVPEPLGDLLALAIWHSGEGRRPSWYIDEILIRDVQTNQVFFFLPSRWLAADKIDGRLAAEIIVATEKELTNVWYRFMSLSTRGLRDGHIWISVVYRPTRSTFTRAQRLTCVLLILLTAMLANIMFYGQERNAEPKDQRSHSEFQFKPEELWHGIGSDLIATFVNVLVTQLFLNAMPRDHVIYVKPEEVPKSEASPSRSSKAVLKPALLQLLETETSVDVFTTYGDIKPKSNSAFISRTKRRFPYWTAYVAWTVAILVAIASSIVIGWYGLVYGRTTSIEWLVSFLIAFFCSLFITQPLTVLLISFVTAVFLKSAVVKEDEGGATAIPANPHVKLIDMTRIVSYKPPSEAWIAAVRKIARLTSNLYLWLLELTWFLAFIISVSIFVYGRFPLESYDLRLSLEAMFVNIHDEEDQLKVNVDQVRTVGELWAYLERSFVPAFAPVVESSIGYDGHFNGSGLGSHASGLELSDWVNIALGSARLRQVRIHRRYCLIDDAVSQLGVCLPEYRWDLHETGDFLPGWLPPNQTDTATTVATTTSEHATTTTTPSTVVEDAPSLPEQSDSTPDPEDPQSDHNDSISATAPWKYTSGKILEMSPYPGIVSEYLGGGHVALLPHNTSDATSLLETLKYQGWVDDLTRAIFLEINTYNPNTNLMAVTIILFEFHQSGIIVPSYNIYSIRLFNFGTTADKITAGFGAFAVFILFTFMFYNIRLLVHHRLKYFSDGWNWLEVAIILLGLTTFGLYFVAELTKAIAIMKLPVTLNTTIAATIEINSNSDNRFVSFYYAVLAETTFLTMAAILIFLCNFKLWRILRIGRQINTLLAVFSGLMKPFAGFMISFFISVLPFVIAGEVIFGRALKVNSTFLSGLFTIVRLMVEPDNKDLYDSYVGIDRVLGPTYFFTAVICTLYIYTNILLAIIMFVYSTIKSLYKEHQSEKSENDSELASFLAEKLMRLFGIKVKHPVVDLTKFPTVNQLEVHIRLVEKLRKKPKNVDPDSWADVISVTQLRTIIQGVVESARQAQIVNQEPETAFRSDLIETFGETFVVEMFPSESVPGPSDFPVNQVSPASDISNDSPENKDYNETDMSNFVGDSLKLYRNALVLAKEALLEQSRRRKRKGHRKKKV